MKRRLLAALAASALLITAAAPVGTIAAGPKRDFERLDVTKFDKSLVQQIINGRDVEVIVELDQASVAPRRLTRAQQVATARQLKANQDKLAPGIKKLGGKVETQYQYAVNAIKVKVSSRKLGALAKLPGVKAVHAVPVHYMDNVKSVPFIGAPAAWQDYGATGSGQTIAVIDSGIDYLHANFGGPGTAEAFEDDDHTVIEDGSFPTAKVIDGWDFVGDDFDAAGEDGSETPMPDPDPIDCFGHGSHVAGTAAGLGVKTDHTTYTGPYNANTYQTSFGIGPGVAPQAKLIALKIFGCEGSTIFTVDALEWVAAYNATHADAIDVVNMSLGGAGGGETADALATDALVASGVVVAASASNDGPNAYLTTAPAAATGAISVAGVDTIQSYPGATIDRATGADINGINQNGFPDLPVSGTLQVIEDDPGTPIDPTTGEGDEHLGCHEADYGTLPANSIAIVQRGVCAFFDKGEAAQAAGAIGVIVINRDDVPLNELPVFLGYAPSFFDIPMIGVARSAKAALNASDGVAATLASGPGITNPQYLNSYELSSGGPRLGDSAQKPDVSAPAENIISTGVGLGYKANQFTGTSMASPHVAGVAALVRQRHPGFRPEQIKALIVGTAVQSKISPFNSRIAGSGLVQPRRAVDSVAYVLGTARTPNLSFGYDQIRTGGYRESKSFTIYNSSASPIVYTLDGGLISLPGSSSRVRVLTLSATTVTVPARSSRTITATVSLTAAQLAASKYASQTVPGGTDWGSLLSYGGVVTATPATGGGGRYQLRVPWRAVPRSASNVVATARSAYTVSGGEADATVRLRNDGAHSTFADVYAWGLRDPKDLPTAADATNDIRAVGLQVLPAEFLTGEADPDDRGLIFAINTYGRWSAGYQNTFVIPIFGAGDEPEFFVLGIDFGLFTTGFIDGRMASFVIDAEGNLVGAGGFVADAPANSSTIELPLLASDIERTDEDSTVDYTVIADNEAGDTAFEDEVDGVASLSVFAPAVSSGDFIALDPGDSGLLDLTVDVSSQVENPSLGWMIVALDDENGAPQADLVPIGDLPS